MKKPVLKPRGIRFSDDQWEKLKNTAKKENSISKHSVITASDVVRFAVDELYRDGGLT